MELNIYDKQGLVVMTVSPESSSQWNHEVGVENVVSVNFTTWQFIALQVGWYILVNGKKFSIKSEYRPKHIHNSKYTYNVKCYGREHDMQDILFCRLNQGEDDFESVFAYDGTPADFLQKVVDNMNRNAEGIKWKAGEALVSNRQTINFNGIYCWDAMNEIARTFNTEWWMDGEYLNLTKCVHGESVSLGYGVGLKAGLTQNENTNASLFFTRLIPVGSSKNIDRSKYGYSSLQLPNRKKYIDINTQLGLKEYREEAAFSEIYPHREGSISSVRSEVKKNEETGEYTVYFVKDASLPFNPDDYMLGGEVIRMNFNSGNLAGKDFDVNWNKDIEEFEIINQYPDETTQLPGGNLVPKAGDKYVLSNIYMPDEYIRAAEAEFQEAVDAFLNEYAKDTSIYSGQTDYIYISKNNVPLSVGQRVKLLSTQYFDGGSRESRITRISRKLNNLNEATIDCTDAVASSWKGNVDSSINQLQFSVAQEIVQGMVDVLKTWDTDQPSNYNVMSALRSLNTHLNKTKDDRSRGYIASDKGFQVGQFESGTLGRGASMYTDESGNTYMESDFLTIRKKAIFNDITVQELKHIGGQLILTPAAMVCSRMEETNDGYKCYFNTKDSEGRELFNEFEVNDQAQCRTFNLKAGSTYYWRLVTAVGSDYIVLSKTDCDANSDIPKAGDNISLLGNRNNQDRQKAVILSAYGPDAPSYKQYKGINGYTLEGKLVTKLSPDGNQLSGIVNIESGSTGAQNLEDLPEEVFKAVHVGAVNLLLNSGFTGDYRTEELSSSHPLNPELEMYSKALEHWTGTATINTDTQAVSGRTATIGQLQQVVKLMAGESYVVSFLAKGTNVQVSCGNFSESIELSANLTRYSMKFISDGNGTFSISGDATIGDLQLERGTIATDWNPSPHDNDKSLAEFQAIQYLSNAIKEGNTSVLGGLVLSSMIMLGNYKNGAMQKVNAGMSGIYNDDDDVAFWAGGTLEQALATIVKFKQNPRYKPTDSEWANLANFVVSHGGDAFFRGNIYAENGYFRGEVEIAGGRIQLKTDGSGKLASGNIYWTPEGVMYRRSPENVVWTHISKYPGRLVDYSMGTYIDVNVDFSDTSEYILLTPDYNDFSIVLSMQGAISRRSSSAIISCPFQVYDGSKWVAVDKIKINNTVDTAGKEIKITYRDGYWFNDGGSVDIVDGVAVLGSNNYFSCSNLYATRGEILILDSYLIDNKQYYVDNERGLSESVNIKDTGGTHSFIFKEGLLLGYSYTSDENGD